MMLPFRQTPAAGGGRRLPACWPALNMGRPVPVLLRPAPPKPCLTRLRRCGPTSIRARPTSSLRRSLRRWWLSSTLRWARAASPQRARCCRQLCCLWTCLCTRAARWVGGQREGPGGQQGSSHTRLGRSLGGQLSLQARTTEASHPLARAGWRPTPRTQVHFIETLHALAGRVAGTEVPPEEEEPVHRSLRAKLPPAKGGGGGARRRSSGAWLDAAGVSGDGSAAGAVGSATRYTVAHYYAGLYVQAAVRGFLQRHRMTRALRAERHGGDGEQAAAANDSRGASAAAETLPDSSNTDSGLG